MRINPKARGDILDYKLTAYKCQAGSHGRDGATSSQCAVNIPHDVIEWLSGDNELNLFAQLLYIDGLLPQVIKVTFQLEHPIIHFSALFECAIGVTFPKQMTEITFSLGSLNQPSHKHKVIAINPKVCVCGGGHTALTKHYPD